jgi:hypothetical protein
MKISETLLEFAKIVTTSSSPCIIFIDSGFAVIVTSGGGMFTHRN